MKNYVQHGDTLDLTAPSGGVVSGTAYLIGTLFGVAVVSADAGTVFPLRITGVFTLPKVSAQAWTEGVAVYWDAATKLATTTATGNTYIGVASAAAANPSASGNVRLNGGTVVPLQGAPATATAVVTAAAANVAEVAITVKDAAGNTVAGVHNIDVWLSDDTAGEGLTATTASGTVAAKAASGVVLDAMVAKKALRVQTLKTGVFTLEITDSAKTAFKVAVSVAGRTVVVATLATASYGA